MAGVTTGAAPGFPVGSTYHGMVGYNADYTKNAAAPMSFGHSNVSPLIRYFGMPEGFDPEKYAYRRNIGLQTLEEQLSGRVFPVATSLLTYRFVTALGRFLLNVVSNITITYDQSILYKQTSYNLIPAQPQAHMTLARNNTRNVMQYLVSSKRVGAGAEARMEDLEGPYGQETADWMLDSVNHSIVFEEELCVLGALVSEGMLRYNLETDGDRYQKWFHADRQILEDTNGFGLFNHDMVHAATELTKHLQEVPYPGKKIVIIPYSALGINSRMKLTDALDISGALVIKPDVARALAFDIQERPRIMPAAPQPSVGPYVLGNSSDAIIYFAPPASMNPAESEEPGILDGRASIASHFRNSAYGPNGYGNEFSGDLICYDDNADSNTLLSAKHALPFLGHWDEAVSAVAPEYPGDYPGSRILNGYSRYVKDYFTREFATNTASPFGFNEVGDVVRMARKPRAYLQRNEAQYLKDMPYFITYGYADIDRGAGAPPPGAQYALAETVGSMYHMNYTHADSLATTEGLFQFLDKNDALKSENISASRAFSMLNSVIEQLRRQKYGTDWANRIALANPQIRQGADGAREFATNGFGGIVIPPFRAGAIGGRNLANPCPVDQFLAGCWSGPMLLQIRDAADTVVATWPAWAQNMRNTLLQCLPVVQRGLELLREVMPETSVLARNVLPVWLRFSVHDPLTAMIANVFGDNGLWVNQQVNARLLAGPADSTAPVVAAADITAKKTTVTDLAKLMFFNNVFIFAPEFPKTPGVGAYVNGLMDAGFQALYRAAVTGFAEPFNVQKDLGSLIVLKSLMEVVKADAAAAAAIAAIDAAVQVFLGAGGGAGARAALNGAVDVATAALVATNEFPTALTDILATDAFRNLVAALSAIVGATDAERAAACAQFTLPFAIAQMQLLRLKEDVLDVVGGGAPPASADILVDLDIFNTWAVDNVITQAATGTERNVGVVGATDTGGGWVRSPLAFTYSDDANSIVNTGFMPCDPLTQGRTPVANTVAAYNAARPFLVDAGADKGSVIMQRALGSAQAVANVAAVEALGTAIGGDADAYAVRSAYGGLPTPAFTEAGARDHALVTAPVMQSGFSSMVTLRNMQLRYQMYNVAPAGPTLLHRLCYMCLIHTPLTLRSMQAMFGRRGIPAPFDVGFFKWAQQFRTSDAIVTVAGSVEILVQPLVTYATADTAHKMASIETDKRSLEYCPVKDKVHLIRSAYVREPISGRCNQFVRPGKTYNGVAFRDRANMENVIAVAECLNRPWNGMIHLFNQPHEEYIRRAVERNRKLVLSYWTAAKFVVYHAFKEYFEYPLQQLMLRAQNSTPNLNDRLEAGLQFRSHSIVINPYSFRGQFYVPSTVSGEFNVKIQGDLLSPLGTEVWNQDGFQKWLNNPNTITNPSQWMTSARM
jgi:hypothetical protein